MLEKYEQKSPNMNLMIVCIVTHVFYLANEDLSLLGFLFNLQECKRSEA